MVFQPCRSSRAQFAAVGVIVGFAVCTAMAAPSSTVDLLPDSASPSLGEAVEIGVVRPIPGAVRGPRSEPVIPAGNPLWSVPLSVLTATVERPIFSASRRPPPRAVAVSAPMPQPVPEAPPPPARPMLTLIGSVVGEGESIAIFLDQAGSGVVRMRPGDVRSGWVLDSVTRREVILRNGGQVEALVLKAGSPSISSRDNPVEVGMMPSYVPFQPRSTPKNGEPDGL